MSSSDPRAMSEMLTALLQPWHSAVEDPVGAQQDVLQFLLSVYANTGYGRQHSAGQVETLRDYREAFPVATYDDYEPLIRRVMAGETDLLLSEEPVGWAITRGTTRDESKFIPMTPTDLRMRVSAGRAMMNYVLTSGRFDLFTGVNLNLNFPSVVGTVQVGDRELEYGYSSGIYVKHVSASTPIRSLPGQDDIDALGIHERVEIETASGPRRIKTSTYPRACRQPRDLLLGKKSVPRVVELGVVSVDIIQIAPGAQDPPEVDRMRRKRGGRLGKHPVRFLAEIGRKRSIRL